MTDSFDMKLNKESFDEWRKWIGKIEDDLIILLNNRQIYKYFTEVVNNNVRHIETNGGEFFVGFIRYCYAVHTAMGIRRHIDTNTDCFSLIRLLKQIKEYSKQFTYDFYLECHPIEKNKHQWQKIVFMKFSNDGKIISEEIINEDIEKLNDVKNKIAGLVDRVYAHLDKRGPAGSVTYNDIDTYLDMFNDIARKYLTLITGNSYPSLQPVIGGNWQKIFTVPLNLIDAEEKYKLGGNSRANSGDTIPNS